jgi:enoyl-CoA hydratase/carnithine racemase
MKIKYFNKKESIANLILPPKFSDSTFRMLEDYFRHSIYASRPKVIIISSESKHFSVGLDLSTIPTFPKNTFDFKLMLERWQQSISLIEKCNIPVIAAIHSYCVGGGVDLISACDIRHCTSNSKFSVKEIDVGLAADLGTLQRLSKIVGNDSFVREICYTGRNVDAVEAQKVGLVSAIHETQDQMMSKCLELAECIASKDVDAIHYTKEALVHARDHPADDGLKYQASINSILLPKLFAKM